MAVYELLHHHFVRYHPVRIVSKRGSVLYLVLTHYGLVMLYGNIVFSLKESLCDTLFTIFLW